jgi:polar amino acid transport system substrate-binding protein
MKIFYYFIFLALLCTFFISCSPDKKQAQVNKLDELKNARFAVVTGTIADKLVLSRFPKATFSYYNSPLEACIAVQQGIELTAAYDEPIFRNIMAKNPGLKILPEMITLDNYGLAVRPDDQKLKNAADSLLDELKADGRYDDMKKRWFPDEGKPAPMPVIKCNGKNGVLNFGTSATTEPFSFFDDRQEIVGFDIEFASLLAHRLGMELNIQNMDFGALIPSLISGKSDIIGACITITEERSKKVLFTKPNYTGGIAAIVKDQSSEEDENITEQKSPLKEKNPDGSNLASSKVGAMTGSLGEMYVRENYPKANVQCYDDIIDAIAALKAKKLDYVITAYTTALRAANKNKDILLLPKEYTNEFAAIAIKKGNNKLLNDINKVIAGFKSDGTLDQVINHWIRKDGSDYEKLNLPSATQGSPLIVAIAANREPMCFVSENKFVGLDCELIERIAFKLGRPVKYSDMKFSALIAALESGKADVVISNMTDTEERRKMVNFTDGYFLNPQVLLTHNNENTGISNNKGWISKIKESFYDNIILEKRYILLWNGLKVTFLISIFSALLGTILGAGICFLRMRKNRGAQLIAKIYIDIFRGVPQVVLLMIMFYVILAPLNISGVTVAIITFAMNFAAYVSEMFRTSIESVNKGQTEAGIAMGLSKVKTFVFIILPQAIHRVLPVYKGEFIALVKMTAIVGYIAVHDLTKASDIIRSRTFDAFFPLIMIAIIYFLLAWGLTYILERIQISTSPKRKRK